MRIAFITAAAILMLALGAPLVAPQLFASGKGQQAATGGGIAPRDGPAAGKHDDADADDDAPRNASNTAAVHRDEDGDDD